MSVLLMPGILEVISYGLESVCLACVESLGDSGFELKGI